MSDTQIWHNIRGRIEARSVFFLLSLAIIGVSMIALHDSSAITEQPKQDLRFNIQVIDGCEYIHWYAARNLVITHKANCTNHPNVKFPGGNTTN